MPFDGNEIQTPALRRAVLVEALRSDNPSWHWDFRDVKRDCGTSGCAIGLACTMWGEDKFGVRYAERRNKFVFNFGKTAEFFGMSYDEVAKIFDNDGRFYKADNIHVSPSMVANALEAVVS